MSTPKILTAIAAYIRKRKQYSALLKLSNSQLIDCGFSPEMLAAGVAGWPWRMPADPAPSLLSAEAISAYKESIRNAAGKKPSKVSATGVSKAVIVAAIDKLEEKRGIAELRRLSDRELADLGVTRGTITEAVRQGRAGIERQAYDTAA